MIIGEKVLWGSKILQHTWDILIGVDNASLGDSDTRTEAVLGGLEFYLGDDEWYTMVVGFSNIPINQANMLLEGAIIHRYDKIRTLLLDREGYYSKRVDSCRSRDPKTKPRFIQHTNRLHDIRLGLRWIEQFRDRELSKKQRDMLVRLYDVKGRMK